MHVLDASRAVGVAGSLLSEDLRDSFAAGHPVGVRDVREPSASGRQAEEHLQPLAGARQNRLVRRLDGTPPPVPCFTG